MEDRLHSPEPPLYPPLTPPTVPTLTRAALARMVAGAASFVERLGSEFAPADDSGTADARLARWRDLVARGDEERFARRLAWDGLDLDDARRGVSDVRLVDGARLPRWAAVVRQASRIARAIADGEDPLLAASDRALPYRELALPFVLVARRRLRRNPHHSQLTADAHLRFEAALLARLCDSAERATAAFLAPTESASADAILTDGMADFFGRFPVLARVMAEGVLAWVETTAELLARLAADRPLLRDTFGIAPDAAVVDARAGLSDPHAGGRTVSILRFADGRRVVYKPRPLAAERGFAAFAAWLNGVTDGPALRPLDVLDRGGYGWTAFAAHVDCADEAAVARFHERAGALLCLAYLLGGEDLHMENVIACGEHPVLIDLEVLLRPLAADDGFGVGDAGQWSRTSHSVLAPGLLPRLRALPDGSALPGGGLVAPAAGNANLPTLAGVPATGHPARDVERGFRRAFRAILTYREAVLAPGGPLSAFAGARARVILRNTAIYDSLLQRTLSPRFLESGAERSIEIDVLTRPVLRFPSRHPLWPAFRDEAAQVERMDVPAFHVAADAVALHTGGGSVPGYAEQSGLDRARQKIRSLSETEMEEQAHCIRVSFISHRLRHGWAQRHVNGGPLAAAREIATWLAALSFADADGSPSWIALGGGVVERAGDSLGQGRAGIGLFFAALAAVEGRDDDRAMAARVLSPVAAAVREPDHRNAMTDRLGIGGVRGMGGIAWSLLRAGELIASDEIRAAAIASAAALTPSRLRADRTLDVFGGTAGALLALLDAHAVTGDEDALARARLCGEHLLASRRTDPVTGLRAWPSAIQPGMSTGFGHGAAGIAYALLRLHRVTGDARLRDAAEEAFAFERALASAHGWLAGTIERDTPSSARPLCGWCSGAAGIGLSRAATISTLASPEIRSDLDRALAAARAAAPAPSTLCCGAMGRTELFLASDHADEARALAASVASRAVRRLTFAEGTLDSAFLPGFFQGIAGIGYQLLRVHRPDRIPSVLLLD